MLLDDRRAYQILDIQSAEKEMRENSTHRQPKQRFRIIQNQCILLLWSRLLRRIILSTGLIYFQWIAKLLFMNAYSCTCICWIGMYLLDSIIHSLSDWAMIFALWRPWCLCDRILNYRLQGITRSCWINFLGVKMVIRLQFVFLTQ